MRKRLLIILLLSVLLLGISKPLEESSVYLRYDPIVTMKDTTNKQTLAVLQDHHFSNVTVVGWEHEMAHDGYLWQYKVVKKGFNSGETTGFIFWSPPEALSDLHYEIIVDGDSETDVNIYEGIAGTAGAELTSIYFKNRNSTRIRETKLYAYNEVTGILLIDPDRFGSGKQTGGGSRGEQEWLAKWGTTHLVEVISRAQGNNYSIWMLAYEWDVHEFDTQ